MLPVCDDPHAVLEEDSSSGQLKRIEAFAPPGYLSFIATFVSVFVHVWLGLGAWYWTGTSPSSHIVFLPANPSTAPPPLHVHWYHVQVHPHVFLLFPPPLPLAPPLLQLWSYCEKRTPSLLSLEQPLVCLHGRITSSTSLALPTCLRPPEDTTPLDTSRPPAMSTAAPDVPTSSSLHDEHVDSSPRLQDAAAESDDAHTSDHDTSASFLGTGGGSEAEKHPKGRRKRTG